MNLYFDSHCHPQFPEYNKDRTLVIQRAIEAGVLMLAVGTSYETSLNAVDLSKEYPNKIWAAVGIHPLESDNKEEIKKLEEIAKLNEVVAIGECGLDYFKLDPGKFSEKKKLQENYFLYQISIANRVKKPLIIHGRAAYDDIYQILKSEKFSYGFSMHFFQGDSATARKFLDLGGYISFAGPITFAVEYDEVIKIVPIDRILIETDSPYASPEPWRGKRNEPAYVIKVAEKIAKVKNLTLEEVAEITTKNAKKLFKI